MAKQLVFSEDARRQLKKGIDVLADAVKPRLRSAILKDAVDVEGL